MKAEFMFFEGCIINIEHIVYIDRCYDIPNELSLIKIHLIDGSIIDQEFSSTERAQFTAEWDCLCERLMVDGGVMN